MTRWHLRGGRKERQTSWSPAVEVCYDGQCSTYSVAEKLAAKCIHHYGTAQKNISLKDSSGNSPSSRASTSYSEFSGDKCSTASSGTMICSVSGSALLLLLSSGHKATAIAPRLARD
ncbi:unnamed protein product [Caretta caretta]